MTLANIHQGSEEEAEPTQAKNTVDTARVAKVNKQKKKVFSLCGLSCVRVKEKKNEFDALVDSCPPRPPLNDVEPPSCAAEADLTQNVKKLVIPLSPLTQGKPISSPKLKAANTDSTKSHPPSTGQENAAPSSPERSKPLSEIPMHQNQTPAITSEIEKARTLNNLTEATLGTHATTDSMITVPLEPAGAEQKNSEAVADSPVFNTSTPARITAAPIDQNDVSKTDTSNSLSPPASSMTQAKQPTRPSGLMGPKIVVNKLGINVYKGRNAPFSSSPLKEEQEESSTNAPSISHVVNAKPTITTEAIVTHHHQGSWSTNFSPSAVRDDHESPLNVSPHAAPNRTNSTGIRMPSKLPRQTPTKQ